MYSFRLLGYASPAILPAKLQIIERGTTHAVTVRGPADGKGVPLNFMNTAQMAVISFVGVSTLRQILDY